MRAAKAGGGRTLLALAASIAAPVVGYAAVRNAAYDATENRFDLAATLPPARPSIAAYQVMRTARQPQRAVGSEHLALAKRVAVSSPLALEPYFIAARIAETQGDFRRATLLMEETRRRRPNYAPTRVALLGYYSLANAYRQAIGEADATMLVSSKSIQMLLPAFAELVARDPRARVAIAESLAAGPRWRQSFLEVAADSRITADDAQALVADIRRLRPEGDLSLESGFLIRTLVKEGRYADARRLWEGLPPNAGRPAPLVADSKFEGGAAFAPFKWEFSTSAEGVAEPNRARESEPAHLAVSYLGQADVDLARQLLVLAPGRYTLQTRARGESSSLDLGFGWHLACAAPAGGRLAELSLLPLREEHRPYRVDFSVPAGCRAQTLVLRGRPGDVSRSLNAEIAEISIAPAGGSAK